MNLEEIYLNREQGAELVELGNGAYSWIISLVELQEILKGGNSIALNLCEQASVLMTKVYNPAVLSYAEGDAPRIEDWVASDSDHDQESFGLHRGNAFAVFDVDSNQRLNGYIVLGVLDPFRIYLDNVITSPHAQGQGVVGRILRVITTTFDPEKILLLTQSAHMWKATVKHLAALGYSVFPNLDTIGTSEEHELEYELAYLHARYFNFPMSALANDLVLDGDTRYTREVGSFRMDSSTIGHPDQPEFHQLRNYQEQEFFESKMVNSQQAQNGSKAIIIARKQWHK